MSDSHPARPALSRGRGRYRLRQLLDCWPLLIWLGLLFLALYIYGQGAQFNRMNGAVDVYQQNIEPDETGRIKKIHVKTGDRVKKGDILVQMDTSELETKKSKLNLKITARSGGVNTRRENDTVRKLRGDRAQLVPGIAGDKVRLGEIERSVASLQAQLANGMIKKSDVLEQEAERDQIKAKILGAEAELSAIDEQITTIDEQIKALEAQIEMDSTSDQLADDDDQLDMDRLNARIANMTLRAAFDGTVDRIAKEEGEILKNGEAVMKIVGDASTMTCFLPQDQLDQVSVGDEVWVAEASAEGRHSYYKTKIINLAPRISTVPDRASPLPNIRLRGRDVVLLYPEEAKAKAEGEEPMLLPGQAVIILLNEPGSRGFFQRLVE